jgi:hypothetical protein
MILDRDTPLAMTRSQRPPASSPTVKTPCPQISPRQHASGKPSTGFRLWQPGAILLLLTTFAVPGLAEAPAWPWPVPTDPPAITGTFMESRETRFHTGLDIRTEGRIGWPVSSPIDGHLRRLRCSARGYGLALYIEAENGQTVVFAHLDRFFAPAAARLRDAQLRSGSYEQDLSFTAGEIPVFRGQVVALSGETGTGAPHLHMEVRDAAERVLNPAGFLEIPDQVPPKVLAIRLIAADPRSPLSQTIEGGTTSVAAGGRWIVEALASDGTGFAPFPVAPRTVSLFVDGGLRYRISNEALAFAQSGQMRLDQRRDERGRWFHMARRDGLTLPGREGVGTLVEVTDRPVEIWIVVEDAAGQRGEFSCLLRPERPLSDVRRTRMWVQERLLVAQVAGGSDLPPLLDGPSGHHLLERVPGGWRLGIEHATLGDGIWKLIDRGKELQTMELGFPDGGFIAVRGGNAPGLLTTAESALFAGGALELRRVKVESTPELEPVGSGLELISHGFVPRIPLALEAEVSDAAHALLMQFDGDEWSSLAAPGPGLRGQTDEFGIVAVMEDLAPPRIGDLTGADRREDDLFIVLHQGPRAAHGVPLPEWPTLEVGVEDEGSGLPQTGPVVLLDGRPWPARYDGERDRILLDWFVAPASGRHVLEVRARDLSGRESAREWDVEFRR